MTIKAVFFDLDGTLLDTSHDLANALNKLRRQHGLPELAYEKIRNEVSNGAGALIKLGFGANLTEDELAVFREGLLAYYLANIAIHTQPFPGIEDLLKTLQENNISWGVVTNKPAQYTAALLDQLTFHYPPVAIVSPEHVGVSKPDPAPLLHACELASCNIEDAIYIGDHLRDIECGQNAGMDTIAVGYGFMSKPNEHMSWNATYHVNHASEIWPIINQLRQQQVNNL